MKADRFNEGKPKWSLVPQSALIPMVRVLEYGSQKYAPYNWNKGLSINEICESLKRHLDAFMEGEDNDPESGLPHIGHIQCNALFLSWMMEHKPEFDDRYKGVTIFEQLVQNKRKRTKNWAKECMRMRLEKQAQILKDKKKGE